MKAVVITEAGGPDVLQVQARDIPNPGPHEVLIKVAASGINRPDVAQRKGLYPAPEDAPADIPGLEVSGTISAIGKDVKNWELGDEVCALVAGGGYGEFVTAPAVQCLPIPEGVSLLEAAALPETFFTVWNNVFDIGGFQAGQTVLVHGGTSGIGVTAIQMIKALGGKVIVTAGSREKCTFCQNLGADLAIHYKDEDFEEVIKAHPDFKKVNIILDMVGGDYTAKNIRLLRPKGKLIMINAMKGRMGEVDLLRIMANQLTLTGSTLRPQSIGYKGHIAKNLQVHVWPFFPEKIKPVIHKVFPLQEAAKAHQLMESSEHIGKILLQIPVEV
ncbi:NAD(P)H-quinone oxidoreductase [Echinicola vietnamensis]|uniref:Putative NAD(P)H quinone oxidoreductase, PIG3 family n=1 Tax=Echinicola vietnamensis (strain DSM 17526 / LMG 23754 / KMM 6221) TaxID=926556 RepID=L0G341_ECHVK|nr:NAD(P)H-quinone oxidoreductase [Echinicola vietnamensis]AGA79947.1 putative NAD(P)H quinone oxidoreductase, PIG3 family [Echinicola vietnamensis DSM 17526]